MNKLSTSQLSQYLSVTKRTIQRRANREDWQYEQKLGLGGTRRLYEFSGLPVDVRQKIVANVIAKHEQAGLNYAPDQPKQPNHASVCELANTPFIVFDKARSGNWLSQHSFAHGLDVTELDKEYVKVGLLVLAKLYVLSFSVGKIKGFDQFCQLYNQRELALNSAIYPVVNRISRITLLRWEKQQLQQGNTHQLMNVDEHGEVMFDRDLRLMAQEILMVSPKITARRLRQHFLTIFSDRKIPSERRLSLWLKQQNEHIVNNGDA